MAPISLSISSKIQGLSRRIGAGGTPPVNSTLSAGTWSFAYSDTATTSAVNGSAVSGLPYGLTGTVSGGVLTVEGTPQ